MRPKEVTDFLRCGGMNCDGSCECSLHVIGDCMTARVHDYVIDLERRVPRWISVEERLPEANVAVLIRARYCNSYKTHIAEITDEGRWVRDFGKRIAKERISHWMPLPEPPEEGDDEG